MAIKKYRKRGASHGYRKNQNNQQKKKRVIRIIKKINGVKVKPKAAQRIIVHKIAYQRGRKDGFLRGNEDGYQLGQQEVRKSKLGNQVASPPSESGVPASLESVPAILPFDVLVITPGIIASLEIGILQPFDELLRRGSFRYEVRLENEVTRDFIAAANTVVFLRNVEPAAYQYLQWAHELGKRTIYVIDDNFIEISVNNAIGQYYRDPLRQETFIKFLSESQIVKVDTPYFENYIRSRFNPNVVYFPASIDFAWIEQIEKPQRENGQIVIGYAGGTKEEAFAPVVPALRSIMEYYGGFVKLEFFGFIPSGLIGHPNVQYIEGGANYRTYLHRLQQCTWDIGLAPLEFNLFNNCKSNNKFRDYSACFIPGIYSALPTYSDWAIHGETGYLMATNTKEAWYAGIQEMIENPSMRQRIKTNAARLSRQYFTIEECVEKWKGIIFV